MSDLISRSALMKKSFVLEGHRVVSYLDVIEAPTAYDVEKVVAELEERRSKSECKYCRNYKDFRQSCNEDCTDALIDDLFDIVKRGGVE